MALWSPRRQGTPGLKAFQDGRWVEYGPDVLDMKSRIEERWPELKCIFDTVDEEWSIIQTDYRGQQSLALGQSFKALNETVFKRLERADEQSRSVEDLEHAVDSHNAKIERDEERKLEDIVGDTAERLMFAFKKDGIYDHDDIYGPKPRRGIAHRAVRRDRTLG
jgi:hypothetical protein